MSPEIFFTVYFSNNTTLEIHEGEMKSIQSALLRGLTFLSITKDDKTTLLINLNSVAYIKPS